MASSVYVSTAYGPPWGGIQGTGTTATGIILAGAPKLYIVAVDPRLIPLHSRLLITPNPFNYDGEFRAEDTGGAIKGRRIDFYDWRGRARQNAWGRRYVTVTILGSGAGQPIGAWAPPSGTARPPQPHLDGSPNPGGQAHSDYSNVLRSAATNVARASRHTLNSARAMGSIIRK